MKIILLIIWVGLALASCPGKFLFNGQYVNCTCTDIYSKRFGGTLDINGVSTIPISFNSTIGIDKQQNLIINISFIDNYTDPVSNIDNNFSCINPVFNKYEINFDDTPAVYTPTIFSSYNEESGYRTWT